MTDGSFPTVASLRCTRRARGDSDRGSKPTAHEDDGRGDGGADGRLGEHPAGHVRAASRSADIRDGSAEVRATHTTVTSSCSSPLSQNAKMRERVLYRSGVRLWVSCLQLVWFWS